jgi:hypothetical protein
MTESVPSSPMRSPTTMARLTSTLCQSFLGCVLVARPDVRVVCRTACLLLLPFPALLRSLFSGGVVSPPCVCVCLHDCIVVSNELLNWCCVRACVRLVCCVLCGVRACVRLVCRVVSVLVCGWCVVWCPCLCLQREYVPSVDAMQASIMRGVSFMKAAVRACVLVCACVCVHARTPEPPPCRAGAGLGTECCTCAGVSAVPTGPFHLWHV